MARGLRNCTGKKKNVAVIIISEVINIDTVANNYDEKQYILEIRELTPVNLPVEQETLNRQDLTPVNLQVEQEIKNRQELTPENLQIEQETLNR